MEGGAKGGRNGALWCASGRAMYRYSSRSRQAAAGGGVERKGWSGVVMIVRRMVDSCFRRAGTAARTGTTRVSPSLWLRYMLLLFFVSSAIR